MKTTVIYIDVLIFTNSIINYCILATVKKYFHIDAKLYRIIISSFISAISSFVIFLPVYNAFFSVLIRIVVSTFTVFIAFGFGNIKTFILNITGFFITSVIFCGGFILIYQVFRPSNMAIINDIVYFDIEPIIMILITLFIYTVIILFSKIFKEKTTNTIVNLKFYINEKEYSCIGKIDTGCNLTEPFSGSPVIITDKTVINDEIEFTRIIPYSTIDNSSYLQSIKADKVIIDNKKIQKEIYIAVSDKPLNIYQAIINSQITR